MNPPVSLMEFAPTVHAFSQVFCEFFETEKPELALAKCPQWIAHGGAANVNEEVQTCFINGFLFNTSSAIPMQETLRIALEEASPLANQFVIPNVRQLPLMQQSVPKQFGFSPMEAGTESLVFVGSNWQTEVALRIGSKRVSELRRYMRKANDEFHLDMLPLKNLSTRELASLDSVFAHHESRYGHKRRLFGTRLLRILASNPFLGPMIRIGVRKNRSGDIVQAMIWIEGDDAFYYLAQAIDRDKVQNTHNLYKTSFAEIYTRANELGIGWVNLGRGNVEAKHQLGANIVFQQSHWIRRRAT